jgi:ATP-dependent exoDNAse (exonuclease V) alpha subunit
LTEISTQELRFRQRQRLTPEEAIELSSLRRAGPERTIPLESPETSLQYAEEHVFERVLVARDYEVLTEALRHGRGRVDPAELKGALTLQEARGGIFRERGEVATAASLRREREMIGLVNGGIGRFEALGGGSEFTVSNHLRAEQRRALEFVLASRDLAVNICGAAGTGKTATLHELRLGLMGAGRGVLAIAPNMSAVEELERVGFKEAITVERLVEDQHLQATLGGKVLIVDEGGMISSRQMREILRLALKHSARIVFSGDTKQIQSVEAGDVLRVLERESRLKSISLTQVQRQTSRDYRAAIQELRRNPERGLERLEAIGAVREIAWAKRAEAAAKAYADAPGQSVLVVCATHEEIARVTEAIRSEGKRSGALGETVRVTRDVSCGWTTAQKQEMRNFRPGQVLGFHRRINGIAKHETAEVVRVDRRHLTVCNEGGEQRIVTARQAKSFDVLELTEIEVAAGDLLLLTANRRDCGFHATNGEIVAVSSVASGGRIELNDGRVLPANFRQFTHGYAVTAHRSQGKTVDSVIISANSMRKELFYVAASRGRQSVVVLTSDKEGLRQSVAQSAARKSASELAGRVPRCCPRGERRGLAAAREIVRRVAQYVNSLPGRIRREVRRERTRERGFGR